MVSMSRRILCGISLLLLPLLGCDLVGPDGPEVDLRVLQSEVGIAEDSASVSGLDPLEIEGVIYLAYGCVELEGTARETSEAVAVSIFPGERTGEGCHDATIWKRYRATVRNVNPGPEPVLVIHQGEGGTDTVTVHAVVVPDSGFGS